MLVTRLPGRLWRVYLSDAGAMTRADDPRGSFQAVADRLGIGMKIGEPQWASKWEILNYQAEHYRKGRVFLCGECITCSFAGGRPGNDGCMQDAFNLCWKLASVISDAAPDSLLDTYEAERRPIGAQITAGAQGYARHRDGIREGSRRPNRVDTPTGWQQQTVELISGLSYNYRETVTACGAAAVPGPQAGDRAPDAQLVVERRKRLFESSGTRVSPCFSFHWRGKR